MWDRICAVAKSLMRSWLATASNFLNVHDTKEGIEYAGRIKNTKAAVVETIPGIGRHTGE